MSEDLDPDAIRTRSFSTARRGFERAEVEAFQTEVAVRVADLETRLSTMEERLGQLGITDLPDLKKEFDTVGEDVRDILQAARDAAEDMRDRAKADASARVAEAQEQAEELRNDAWEASEAMVEAVRASTQEMESKASEDSLFARAEAEREALRLAGDARRDSEELRSSAQRDAEQTSLDARTEATAILESAQQSAELADERVRALEGRREELMAELETAREALSAVEDKIEGRTSELTHATTDPSETSVRVLTDDDDTKPDIGDWLDADATVRLVPRPPGMTMEPVDADELAAEVESLRSVPATDGDEERPELELLSGGSGSSAESASLEFEITSGDAIIAADASATAELIAVEKPDQAPPPESPSVSEPEPASASESEAPSPPVAEVEAQPTAEPEPEPEPEPQQVEPVADEAAPASSEPEPVDKIDDLFASLRTPPTDDQSEVPEQPEQAAPTEVSAPPESDRSPDTAETTQPEPPAAAPVATPAVTSTVGAESGPLDLRDRLLVPVTNDVLRSIKREIVDVQNAVLEELRTEPTDWRPKRAMFDSVLGEESATLAAKSYLAGVTASGELSGLESPTVAEQATHELSGLVTDLWEAVVDAIDGAADGGSRERGASVGRIFRAWRTDEAERRVRHLARAEYNIGVAAGLSALGLEHAVTPLGRDLADPDSTVFPAS